jgi:uncharacterized membrane protein YdbT with pleckstrin-like domain
MVRQEIPMSYVQRVLQPGEVVRHTAAIHWIVYWTGTALMIAAVAVLVWARFLPDSLLIWMQGLAALLAIVALFLLAREWFLWWTTEVAVTNLRVIYKTGLIRRKTNEMNMDKVESVQVEQSILGRILDYGKVSVTGTGAGLEALDLVAQPIELRNSITGVSHNHDVQSPQNPTTPR